LNYEVNNKYKFKYQILKQFHQLSLHLKTDILFYCQYLAATNGKCQTVNKEPHNFLSNHYHLPSGVVYTLWGKKNCTVLFLP